MGVAGQKTIIVNAMSRKNKTPDDIKQKIKKVVDLLKFVRTLDDEEIVKSTIESVIELLEDEINK